MDFGHLGTARILHDLSEIVSPLVIKEQLGISQDKRDCLITHCHQGTVSSRNDRRARVFLAADKILVPFLPAVKR